MSPDPATVYDDLTLPQQVWRAHSFSRVAHAGQLDKAGCDYFLDHIVHAIKMFEMRARKFPGEFEANLDEDDARITKIALYLHDVLEDTPVTTRMLIDLGFPARAISMVDLMTRREGTPKHLYYSRLAKQPEGRFAKAADMDSNTSPYRLGRLDLATQERLLVKYIDGFERIEMTPLHDLPGMLEAIRSEKAESGAQV